MNAYAWTALALVLLPAAVGWMMLLRPLWRRYLERHEARQVRQINAERVTLTRSGPKAGA